MVVAKYANTTQHGALIIETLEKGLPMRIDNPRIHFKVHKEQNSTYALFTNAKVISSFRTTNIENSKSQKGTLDCFLDEWAHQAKLAIH